MGTINEDASSLNEEQQQQHKQNQQIQFFAEMLEIMKICWAWQFPIVLIQKGVQVQCIAKSAGKLIPHKHTEILNVTSTVP